MRMEEGKKRLNGKSHRSVGRERKISITRLSIIDRPVKSHTMKEKKEENPKRQRRKKKEKIVLWKG